MFKCHANKRHHNECHMLNCVYNQFNAVSRKEISAIVDLILSKLITRQNLYEVSLLKTAVVWGLVSPSVLYKVSIKRFLKRNLADVGTNQ